MPKKTKKQVIEDEADYKAIFDIFGQKDTGNILMDDIETVLKELEEPVDSRKIDKVLADLKTKDEKLNMINSINESIIICIKRIKINFYIHYNL